MYHCLESEGFGISSLKLDLIYLQSILCGGELTLMQASKWPQISLKFYTNR